MVQAGAMEHPVKEPNMAHGVVAPTQRSQILTEKCSKHAVLMLILWLHCGYSFSCMGDQVPCQSTHVHQHTISYASPQSPYQLHAGQGN
jgi:hypothetical protein